MQGVRRLPTIRLNGTDYFIDERLREFRAVWNPHHCIEFDSGAGLNMVCRTAIVHCPRCEQEFGVALAPAAIEEMVCPSCQTVVEFARMRPPRHRQNVDWR
jgi:hypothetical protein